MAMVSARSFCEANSTYRKDWPAILEIPIEAEFPLCRCESCSFVFAGWHPPDEFLTRVYDGVIDAEAGARESIRFSWMAHQARILATVLDSLERRWGLRTRNLRALDVGCSYGNQLQMLRAAGLEVLGVETSVRAQKHLEDRLIPFVADLGEAMDRGPFDVVILNEVLEHLPEFRPILDFVVRSLSSQGLVWISVPDFSDWRLRSALDRLERGELPTRELNLWEHLNYFNPRSLRGLVAAAGLRALDLPYSLALSGGQPGWQKTNETVLAGKGLLRWFVKGAPARTELLAERA